jgi:putative ABC transport system permease protein
MLLDLRYALRNLRRTPGIVLIALLTVALGVGVNTAMFSLVHAVVLSPLPYAGAERLVALWPEKRWSITMLGDVQERVTSYEATSAYTTGLYALHGDGPAEPVPVGLVTPAHLDVLGVQPRLGGGFVPGDGEGERGAVVVLGHDFWQERYAGDPGIVGRTIRLVGHGLEERTVVGVLGADARPLPYAAQVWVPMRLTPGQPGAWGAYAYEVVGRLRPGVPVAFASQELRGLVDELAPVHPTQFRDVRYSPVDVVPLLERLIRDVRRQLLVLLGAVAFILLIACTNVANLLLARAEVRQRLMAVQLALGSSRRRVLRQVLTESVLLAVAGGLLGLLAASLTLSLMGGWVAAEFPRTAGIGMEWPVLAFGLAISVAAGLLMGLIPAVRATRAMPGEVLRATAGRGQTQGRRAGRVNDALVVTQIALSMVLLAGAGLMLKSLWQLGRVDTGMHTEHVLSLQLMLPPARYDSLPVRELLRRQVEEQVAALPGVAAAGFAEYVPLGGIGGNLPYAVEGQEPTEGQVVLAQLVSPGYFDVVGIRAVAGRLLGEEDVGLDTEYPALVANASFARQHWPGARPDAALGARVHFASGSPLGLIVGVVEDVRNESLVRQPVPELYGSVAQAWLPPSSALLVRGARDLPQREAVIAALHRVDPELGTRNVRSLDEVLHAATGRTRLYARLLTGFAGLALFLGLVGVYGVISYSVARRTGELGVRIAFGASGREIVAGVMRRALAPVGVGIVLGVLGSLALTRLLAGVVFDVEVTDPGVLVTVALLLATAGAAAALVPAARATRISPVQVLQGD